MLLVGGCCTVVLRFEGELLKVSVGSRKQALASWAIFASLGRCYLQLISYPQLCRHGWLCHLHFGATVGLTMLMVFHCCWGFCFYKKKQRNNKKYRNSECSPGEGNCGEGQRTRHCRRPAGSSRERMTGSLWPERADDAADGASFSKKLCQVVRSTGSSFVVLISCPEYPMACSRSQRPLESGLWGLCTTFIVHGNTPYLSPYLIPYFPNRHPHQAPQIRKP